MSVGPLEGVVVSVDGKPAGSTDKAGKFVYTFKGVAKAGAATAPL
jgi:hypothetical protein